MEKLRKYIIALGAAVITFYLVFYQAFIGYDRLVSDNLFQRPQKLDNNIHIIAIDDKTLDAYGTFTLWSREKSAELIQILNADLDLAPSVICFDVLFTKMGDSEQDKLLAEAVQTGDNILMATKANFKPIPVLDEDGKYYVDNYNIESIDMPIDGILENVETGFSNTIPDTDGYVRQTIRSLNYEGEIHNSLAYQAYADYQTKMGKELYEPEVNEDNLYYFRYTGKPGTFDIISMVDVLEGRVSPVYFKDSIVFVGAYAKGMQDAYTTAIDHAEAMNGVEIHASIVNALMQQTTQTSAGRLRMAIISALIAAVCCLLFKKLKVIPSAIIMVAVIAAYVWAAFLVYDKGYIMPILVLPSVIIILYVEAVVEGYIAEIKRRRKIVGVFKQYMAPQIVDEISKQKDFSISLGGRKRHIAALFVDIRGFTTMSEVLDPEQVVEILNEYLALTTDSVFKNNGTLDKFVGDCTMAVFNSPIDLDDYVFRAVKAAWDMKVGSEPLSKKLEERFGRTVHFGIGVNCGDAVVGNIGCDFRMDYTAIGDTVNTAARLEANAKASQILISQAVLDEVKDRVKVTPIGEIPLKGKSVGIMVYQVDDVNPDGYGESAVAEVADETVEE